MNDHDIPAWKIKLLAVGNIMDQILADRDTPLWLAGLCAGFAAGAESQIEQDRAAADEARRMEVFDDWLKARTDEQ